MLFFTILCVLPIKCICHISIKLQLSTFWAFYNGFRTTGQILHLTVITWLQCSLCSEFLATVQLSTWSNNDRSRGMKVFSLSTNQLFVNNATRMPSALRHFITSIISGNGAAYLLWMISKNWVNGFKTTEGSLRFCWNSSMVTLPFSSRPHGPNVEEYRNQFLQTYLAKTAVGKKHGYPVHLQWIGYTNIATLQHAYKL